MGLILVDQDATIADFERALLDAFRARHPAAPFIAGVPRALQEMLDAGHAVFVCTSPLSGTRWCMPEKLAWVEKHLGESWVDRVIITKDKTLVGDPLRPCVLVDDRPGVAGLVKPPLWQQVLFDAPYNRSTAAPRMTSWADWRQALAPYL